MNTVNGTSAIVAYEKEEESADVDEKRIVERLKLRLQGYKATPTEAVWKEGRMDKGSYCRG